ncbi:MAG: Holliday junction branch migration protein RuvA [Candidatus Levybacteria bacterium]|nr:Holliday junction branch migration protein RuvA [Candidatus Levybacteria bacterium]
MIGMLHGAIALKNTPAVIIDVRGVGYKVLVSHHLFSTLGLGAETTLFIYTHVREDVLELYGFLSAEDLRLFEMLISVSGVGCKSALGVFSVGSRSEIVNAIVSGDVNFFTAVPRLGKKNGQKIIIELKSKLGSVEDLDLSQAESSEQLEAIAALQAFGFTRQEAEYVVGKIKHEGKTTEEIVRIALKQLGK